MDAQKLNKIEPQLAAWRKHVADVGVAVGRINELSARFNTIQLAVNEAKDVTELQAQFAVMAETLNDAEHLFRELELSASASKVAARNSAAGIKRILK